VVRIRDGPKALALTCDVTPRYCEADPFEGGKQAVAEAWRNLVAVGARPLAVTDNLNFGNPERPEIMGQVVGAIGGIAEACKALDFPVVSGNVSLYNETNGRAILPTPTIGGVGLIDDFTKSATLAFKAVDEAILLLGEANGWLGQSLYLREICEREDGAPPPVDLAAERVTGDPLSGEIADQHFAEPASERVPVLVVVREALCKVVDVAQLVAAKRKPDAVLAQHGDEMLRAVTEIRRHRLAQEVAEDGGDETHLRPVRGSHRFAGRVAETVFQTLHVVASKVVIGRENRDLSVRIIIAQVLAVDACFALVAWLEAHRPWVGLMVADDGCSGRDE